MTCTRAACLLTAVLVAGAGCKDKDIGEEELERPVSLADYRLKNVYCIYAVRHPNEPSSVALHRRCGAVAFDVVDILRPRLPTSPLPEFPTGIDQIRAREGCKHACVALSYADRSSPKWAPVSAEIAKRCVGVDGCSQDFPVPKGELD